MSKNKGKWEWKRPRSHQDQPLVEWWFEQIACIIVLRIGMRAIRRGDQRTRDRMLSISRAGKAAEAS